jgi:hypothetical protein
MSSGIAVSIEPDKRETILEELNRILESRFFCHAARSRQFLRYVVEHALHSSEPLKERTIGVELFDRRRDYATGDDPVVRVQAGEVRRRLDQYYGALTTAPAIRIEIPVGSYSPLFSEVAAESALGPFAVEPGVADANPGAEHPKKWLKYWPIGLICAVLLVTGAIALGTRGSQHQATAIDEFWKPVFTTPQPVLVCIAKATVYRPTDALFERYSRTHSGAFQATLEKFDKFLPLDPKEKISWGEMREDPAFGVARGDAYAAVTLSALLGRIGKPDQVRIGPDYSFSDLKNSPSVIVGAFNNRWTLQITSGLHFAFVAQNGQNTIREQGGNGRMWGERYRNNNLLDPVEDSAIVARLLDSGTGQFTIIVAGVGELGTQAASELVTKPDLLDQAVRTLPAGWQRRNLEIVLQTVVTDTVPGPPHVIATYSW